MLVRFSRSPGDRLVQLRRAEVRPRDGRVVILQGEPRYAQIHVEPEGPARSSLVRCQRRLAETQPAGIADGIVQTLGASEGNTEEENGGTADHDTLARAA